MNPFIKDFLAMLGIISMGVIGSFIIYATYEAIKDCISRARWIYRYKHRFDKPPTAECYCKDCKKHSDETNRCYKFERQYTADNWFCWDADPREK